MKKLLILPILLIGLFTSCKEETCPEPFCTMTFNFSVKQLIQRADLPVDRLTMFLMDEAKKQRIGPIYLDISNAAQGATLSSDGTYTFSLTQPLPYGEYKMWIWGNVQDESVASFDWYSLKMKSNYAATDYLLAKAEPMSIHQRHLSCNKTLERLTAQVTFTVAGSNQVTGISLYAEPIFTRVNADMEYGFDNALSRIDFELGSSVVPPTHAFIFPSSEPTGSSFNFEYRYEPAGNRGADMQQAVILAGGKYDITFHTQPATN